MADALYTLDKLTVAYPSRPEPALMVSGSHRFDRGEIVAIIGPSGAGKSTLLRVLGLIERPTGGTLELLGAVLDARTRPTLELRRRVALVFQRPILLDMPVSANVAYGLKIRGRGASTKKVDDVLRLVGLRHLRDAASRTLSGGEAQRVALARALVIEPDVLLLDEPTANLDPYNVGLIEGIIRAAHLERGMSIIMVTHNVFQAKRVATRAGLMLNGDLIEFSPATEFFERPHDYRTAAFVRGDMVW